MIAEQSSDISHKKILLVEDNEDDIILVRETFFDDSFSCALSAVRSGDEALAYLRKQGKYEAASKPDIILLDINMPGKNGIATLEEIKGDPHLASIPVIILTTSKRYEDAAQSLKLGAMSYMVKPLETEKLKKVLRQIDASGTSDFGL